MKKQETKRYSQQLLARLEKFMPSEELDLFNEISHLVVDLRKAAAQAPPPEAAPYIAEAERLRRKCVEWESKCHQTEAECQQRNDEFAKRCKDEFDKAEAQLLVQFEDFKHKIEEKGREMQQLFLDVHCLGATVEIWAYDALTLDLLEVARTLSSYMATRGKVSEYALKNGDTLVWSLASGEGKTKLLGLYIREAERHRWLRAKRPTRKEVLWEDRNHVDDEAVKYILREA